MSEVKCPTCRSVSPQMDEMTASQLHSLNTLVDTQEWRVYREVVRFGALRATDRLVCETDPAKLLPLQLNARLWIYLLGFEDWVREMSEKKIGTDELAQALVEWMNNQER